jgi:glycosyltransferase involved in cell wall biosynthesis
MICRESNYSFKYGEVLGDFSDVKFITKKKLSRLLEIIHSPTLLLITPKGIRGKESTLDLLTLFALPLTLSRSHYDVVICHDQYAGISGYIASKTKNIPYVVYAYEILKYGALDSFKGYGINLSTISRVLYQLLCSVELEIFEGASHVIAISQKTAGYILKLSPHFSDKVRIVYPGCYPVANPITDRENYVLALSRWDGVRNPRFLLDIAQRVKYARFVVAGAFTPHHLELEFRREIKARGLTNRVKVMPNLTQGLIDELYRKAIVNIRWGYEGFGMSVLESMANACPVIVQKELGASEIVKHGINGFVVNGLDPDGFASYISTLLENRVLAKKMGLEAWQSSKIYTWARHAEELEKILKNFIKR